jgi:hypothetical protein
MAMHRRQQLIPSPSSSSNSNRLDIKSCFNTEYKQEETDVNTKLTDNNKDINKDNKADLPDLE